MMAKQSMADLVDVMEPSVNDVFSSADVARGYMLDFVSPSGDGLEPVLRERINADGVYEVYQDGWESLQEKIEAQYPDTILSNILRRAGLGDPTALNAHPAVYGDVVGMATNVFEAADHLKRINEMFASLPESARSQFKDVDDFIGSAGTPRFSQVFTELLHGSQDVPAASSVASKEGDD